jgi:hypothetical protein
MRLFQKRMSTTCRLQKLFEKMVFSPAMVKGNIVIYKRRIPMYREPVRSWRFPESELLIVFQMVLSTKSFLLLTVQIPHFIKEEQR